jgi:hypothetical protein
MIIRNKFNGYGFDGARLYHDPISLSIAATQAGVASSAAAAAAAAAAAPAVVAPTLASVATPALAEAGKTAALEASKQGIIQNSMQTAAQQAAQQGASQLGQQAASQLGQQAASQLSEEAIKQVGGDAMTKGIAQVAPPTGPLPPAGIAPTTPPPPAGPLPPAGSPPVTGLTEGQQAYMRASTADLSGGAPIEMLPPKTPADPSQSFAPFKSNIPSQGPAPNFMSPQTALPKGAPYSDPGTFARVGADQGIAQMNTMPTSELMFKPTYAEQFPLAPKNALQQGFETGLQYVKDNPMTTGMGLMSAGQYLNKPEEEDKDKYKNTVDMSEFQSSTPTQRPFTRSYEYQGYAVGGPVEQMSAMNAVGANTGYPMAGINTPVYSNPMMQRPEATNVIAPSADAGVGAYSGEQRFAEGGLSAAERREYGLQTRGQRASRNLTKAYEEMEEARQKEAMKLMGKRSDPGIVPRSRTQMLSSPFSAAQAEHARLGKKAKVPVVEMPKTNLGDIDNYMDIPIEAANGGIMSGLGGYSDGGRLLKGPGDGVSDSIPAVIGRRQPARLADGEFVVPARIVSELGNGSTEAGARKLYAMMDRVQNSRKKSIGKKKVAVNSKSDKHLPA